MLLKGKVKLISVSLMWRSLLIWTMAVSGFPGGTSGKNPPANAGDTGDVGSILGSGRSPGGGHGNPLHYSCLENPMDRGAWGFTAHGVTKFQTRLKRPSTHTCTHKKRNFPVLCRVTSGGFYFLQEKLWIHCVSNQRTPTWIDIVAFEWWPITLYKC